MSASSRARDAGKVLDQVARQRRQKKAVEALEQDNYQEEPHANLVMSKRAPKFEEKLKSETTTGPGSRGGRKKKGHPTEYYKKYRKTIAQYIDEEIQRNEAGVSVGYLEVQAGPSKYPPPHFCNVCGNYSKYSCVQCGARTCSLTCVKTHQETRCLKWAQ